MALTRALELSKEKQVNVYTDSKYAFLVLLVHEAIWREGEYLTANSSLTKYHQEIDELLTSVFPPEEGAVAHCKGLEHRADDVAQGNGIADLTAKAAASSSDIREDPLMGEQSIPSFRLTYSTEEIQRAQRQLLRPASQSWRIMQSFRQTFRLGRPKLRLMVQTSFAGRNFSPVVQQVVSACGISRQNNPKAKSLVLPGHRHAGGYPGEDWQIDSTQMPESRGFQCVLVLVETFTNRVEAFPRRTGKAQVVIKVLLNEIIPRLGLPQGTQSDPRGLQGFRNSIPLCLETSVFRKS